MEVHPELINSIDLSVDEVHQELVNLQKDKAGGPNCVPAYLPQIVADFLAAPLSKLFQLSFSTGSLPRDWVTAILVYKKSDSHLSSNYRPISLTSIVIKVMEKIIHHQLVKALESHNLISNYQHGFHGCRSTVSLLLTAIHDWAACLERCHSVHCIFLDLATGPPTGGGGGGGGGTGAFGPGPHEY